MAEDFTSANLVKVAHCISYHIKSNADYGFGGEEYKRSVKNVRSAPKIPTVVIGYDTRYLSEEFAREAAEAFASNGISVILSDREAPTPSVAWAVMENSAVGGVTITASHNPWHYNGLKWTPFWGGPAIPAITNEIEAHTINISQTAASRRMPFQQAVDTGLVEMRDLRPGYIKQIFSLLDSKRIRKSGLKVAVDSVYGTARSYLRPFLEKLGVSVTGLHEERDVFFGGSSPDTSEETLGELKGLVLKKRLHLGLACDGDADRFGIIDSDGNWVSPNEVLGLVLEHLVKNRGMTGKVCRSVMTSHFVDAVAGSHGLKARETAVGFKYIGDLLRTGQYLLGGEESGGLTVNGHVPEKDGILACLLIAEMVAFENKPLGKIRQLLHKKVGEFVNVRINLRLEGKTSVPGGMHAVTNRLRLRPPLELAGGSVWRIDQTDGFKFIMKDGSWLGLRPSGTEPVVRIYAEASNKARLDVLVNEGRKIVRGKW